MKETKIHCASFFIFAVTVALLFSMLPLLQPQPSHPYSSWYPFEVNHSGDIKFYSTAVYEAFCSFTAALLNVSTDVFIYALIGIVYYQIQLLGFRLSQIGWDQSKYCDYERRHYFKRVIECIFLHREINRFVRTINPFPSHTNRSLSNRFVEDYHRLFNSIIFVQIFQSVIVYSMTTLRLMIVSHASQAHALEPDKQY